jgi:cytochrome b-561
MIIWQWLFGFLFFWFPRAPAMTREMAAPLHITAGIAIFLMTICTAETGLMEKSIVPGSLSEGQVINFTGLFILLFGVAVTVTVALRRISM